MCLAFWVVPSLTDSNVYFILRGTGIEVAVVVGSGIIKANKSLTVREKMYFLPEEFPIYLGSGINRST